MSRVLFVAVAAALLAVTVVASRSVQAEYDRSWVTCPGLVPSELRLTNAEAQPPVSFVVRGELPDNFSLRAYTTVPGDVRVEFLVDGEPFATENHAPYSLFGDDGYTLNRGSIDARPTILTAIVYQQWDAVALAIASTAIAPKDTPSCAARTPPPVSPTTPGDSPMIAFQVDGSPPNNFTLHADAALSGDIRVEFVVGDELFAIENNPPYSLFGDDGYVMNTGSLGAGPHAVTANVYEQDGAAVLASGSTVIGGEPSSITPTQTVTPVLPPPTPTRTPTPASTQRAATPTHTSTPIPPAPPATQTPTPTFAPPTATATRTSTPTAALPPTVTPTLPVEGGTRDKYLWPFASTSPWNMPIGSGAQYTPANLGTPSGFFFEDEFLFLDPSAPVRTLAGDGHAWPASCAGGPGSMQVRVRDGATIPGGGASYQPNNTGAAILANDSDMVQEFLASCRNNGSGNLFAGWFLCKHSLKGSGVGPYCGHGGSGLTAVGGSLRLWELAPGTPIRHALKLTMPVSTLSDDQVGQCDGGHRWPAIIADAGWNDVGGGSNYSGGVNQLCMGALLALPPSTSCDALVAAELSRRICAALRDYGAYVVDVHPNGPNWRPFTINGEIGVGGQVNGSQMITLFGDLQVITNNSSTSIGGGGTPRMPLAPAIGN